jgi:glycine dehydrogenase subunit 2
MTPEKLIFAYSKPGKKAYSLPETDAVTFGPLSKTGTLPLPEVSEIDVVRHYTKLSRQNYGVDNGFYPLGSCTMKYNPKINEDIANAEIFAGLNPNDETSAQGLLKVLYTLEQNLCTIFGYDRFSLQPAAGAHGELSGLLVIRAYHLSRKDTERKVILVPDSSHGTNPASCSFAGFSLVTIKSTAGGSVDLDDLKAHLNPTVAGLMLTNPSTIGLFEENITEIAKLVHDAGGLLYYDGANANATMGIAKPAVMGFDVCHINLHKTFATPHGGGGPGAGPIGVVKKLVPFLPKPIIDLDQKTGQYYLNNELPNSIGKVHGFYGNISVLLKAYTYIQMLGSKGLHEASQMAVLNANYIKARLKDYYDIPFPQHCQHEFVISAKNLKKEHGVSALDIAKRLMDYGYHPPTIYFPLIVSECLMIEPTETESKETLDAFCEAMIAIAKEAKEKPELLKNAPSTTIIQRLDEVKAVKEPNLNYFR